MADNLERSIVRTPCRTVGPLASAPARLAVLMKYRLRAHSSDDYLEFEWDSTTGQLAGRHASQLREMVDDAKRAGYCRGAPHPTPHKITDPLRKPSEMALILGSIWRLPPELAAFYPRRANADTELPPGAIP